MKMMQACIGSKRLPLLLAALAFACSSRADTLSLVNAETLALGHDPLVQSVEARRAAMAERAIAAGELPDPMVKLGVLALPADTFNLGQEPMTQVQLGVVQKFPRGRSRTLKSDQFSQRTKGLEELAQDQRLRVLLSVREEYFEVLKQRKLAAINNEAIAVFSDLAEITQDYYATGRVPQQDVLQAAVELAKAQDRATRILQEEDRARARLAAWIGDSAYLDISDDWPDLGALAPKNAIRSQLAEHPRIRAMQQNVVAAETGIELARQSYKPEFALDISYGARGGRNPDGRNRADLLSMMLVMDVPLFTSRRQNRVLAASVAESSAAMYNRDDVFRRMRSEVDLHAANLRHERERIELFETTLLPDASFNAEATFEAYQAAVEDLTTLMRAHITEYELQLEYARLQAESLKTRARLLYLQGEAA